MSLVKLVISQYSIHNEEERKLAANIWPQLLGEDKYPTCEDVFMDIDDVPEWVDSVNAISIRTVKKLRVVSNKSLDFDNKTVVREVLKTVNQIVMPGFELLKYCEIQNLDDCCTSEIANELKKGWRIIAVLPQPNQRRPDYIMVREYPK